MKLLLDWKDRTTGGVCISETACRVINKISEVCIPDNDCRENYWRCAYI